MPQNRHTSSASPGKRHQASTEPPLEMPEWLEAVRLRVEREAPLMQALIRRSIMGVLRFSNLSEESVVNATSAPTDVAALVRALSSKELLSELLEDLKQAEPLAPAFIRGIQAKRRLIEENGGALSSEQVAQIIGISRQAVEKRRSAGKLIAISTGRHGFLYPVWQFDESGTLEGLQDVLAVLQPHDEWMRTIFFVSKNPHLSGRTPVEMLRAGKLKEVLDAALIYGEHGSA
jgi:hypothetical protein